MRTALVAVGLAVMMAGGCAAEKNRAEKEEKISAARLGGKFRHDDPLVKMLSPDERAALDRAGMLAPRPEGEELAGDPDSMDADPTTDGEEKSTADKAGDVMMSVLSVGVTLGMMAAPYLLF
jgi:hypothetical protein